MDLTFIFLAGGIFFFGIMVYVAFMIFLPEWVGITGKKALEAERAHVGDLHESEVGRADAGPASDALKRMESVRSKPPVKAPAQPPVTRKSEE
jgi:hypothetical protein